MNNPVLKLKLAVTATPVINGFSYPFLRLLVNKAQELEKQELVFTQKREDILREKRLPGTAPTGELRPEAETVLRHLAEQLRLQPHMNECSYMSLKYASEIIRAGQFLLSIFEATNEDLEPRQAPAGQSTSL
jgi:hypothetical protein